MIPGLGRSPGEGKSYPLRGSGLQNSMDGVANSWTRLSGFHFRFHSHPGHEGFSFGDTHESPLLPEEGGGHRGTVGTVQVLSGSGEGLCSLSSLGSLRAGAEKAEPAWAVLGVSGRMESESREQETRKLHSGCGGTSQGSRGACSGGLAVNRDSSHVLWELLAKTRTPS